jgi:hypothetical protein
VRSPGTNIAGGDRNVQSSSVSARSWSRNAHPAVASCLYAFGKFGASMSLRSSGNVPSAISTACTANDEVTLHTGRPHRRDQLCWIARSEKDGASNRVVASEESGEASLIQDVAGLDGTGKYYPLSES